MNLTNFNARNIKPDGRSMADGADVRQERLFILPVLLLTLLVGNPAFSADFQRGADAAQKGDYAIALREWTPLAKQRDADTQTYLGNMST